MNALPWVEKYRPFALTDLVSNNAIVAKLLRFHERNAIPNLLFYGPPGTGKTSTALAYARTLHGAIENTGLLLELNASDERNIATIKDTVYQFVSNRPLLQQLPKNGHRPLKLVVLDEADAMTAAAQDALTHLMDHFARQVRFCLICNRISNVSAAVQSRCTKFRFAPLGEAQVRCAVQRVLDGEHVKLAEPEVMDAILHIAHGDLRRCFNVLQACVTLVAHMRLPNAQTLTSADVYAAIGRPTPDKLVALIQNMTKLGSTFQDATQALRHFLLYEAISLDDVLHLWHDSLTQYVTAATTKRMLTTHYQTLAAIERRIQHNTHTYLNDVCFVSAVRDLLLNAADAATLSVAKKDVTHTVALATCP